MKNGYDVELLSPAGDRDCFFAALNAGADAVYMGLNRFSARAGAANFSDEELCEALDLAHILDRKIYLTVNTLFKDAELCELYDMLYEPYVRGLDGVIVQDVGVMSEISRMFPHLPIHVSTQAAVTASEGVEFLDTLHVTRIVPARELSLAEVRDLKEKTGRSIECFIHGSLCYSYSGKCLMSSMIGGRSGNRGKCAQPCRLPYDGSFPLSLKDLCTVDILPDLIEAGISSFKIEGRMKSAGYVYRVTSIYRKYIDMYLAGERYIVDENDRKALISEYTRSGNCRGYYGKYNGRDMITIDSPSYSTSPDEAPPDITRLPAVGANISCSIRPGTGAEVTVYNEKESVTVTAPVIPEKAVKCALTEENVQKQLARSGGTAFDIQNISVELEDGMFLPNGKINEIRRYALEAFRQKILEAYRRDDPTEAGHIIRSSAHNTVTGDGDLKRRCEVRLAVSNVSQLRAAAATKADGIIIPYSLYRRLISEKGEFPAVNVKVYIALPYVIRNAGRNNDSGSVRRFIEEFGKRQDISGFYVSDFESARILSESSFDKEITADIHMYAYNKCAYDFYRRKGINKTTVPVELNERELIHRGITGEEFIVYGKIPMMISANCVYNTQKGCDKKPDGHFMYITDRKGERFPVLCSCPECTNVIFNSVPLSTADNDRLFDAVNPSSVRFCFTDESPETLKEIVSRYYEHRKPNGSAGVKLSGKYTNGHLKRGV